MLKKVVIVCNAFYPDESPRSYRATQLVNEFARRNIEVTLICPDKNGIEIFLENKSVNYVNLGKLTWKIPMINSSHTLANFINRIVSRLLPKLFEFPSIELFFKVSQQLRSIKDKNYDLLISIAVPYTIHWGVAKVWSSNKSKNIAKIWVADCGDPYFTQQNDTIPTPFYFKWIEKWFMQKPDFISVPTEKSYLGYFSDFHSKIRVIPQGFNFDEINIGNYIQSDVIKFGYAGGFTKWRRDPSSLCDFLCSLPQEFLFEFHVFTKDTDFVQRYSNKDSRIILHDYIPREQLLYILSEFDFVINFENRGEIQTPSKIIDYAIVNRPILSLKSFDLELDKLRLFLNRNYTQSLILKNVEQYKISNVVQKFIDLTK